jgi:hypothetical protein
MSDRRCFASQFDAVVIRIDVGVMTPRTMFAGFPGRENAMAKRLGIAQRASNTGQDWGAIPSTALSGPTIKATGFA